MNSVGLMVQMMAESMACQMAEKTAQCLAQMKAVMMACQMAEKTAKSLELLKAGMMGCSMVEMRAELIYLETQKAGMLASQTQRGSRTAVSSACLRSTDSWTAESSAATKAGWSASRIQRGAHWAGYSGLNS